MIDVPSWEPICRHEVIHEWVSLGLSKEVGKQYFRVTNDFYLMELTMMKGGARVRLDGIDYDEGWCASETWPWWRVVWAFALHDNTVEKNWLWWRVVWDFTLHNNTWVKNWLWWRVVWAFTLHDNTSGKNWPWWRVVWDFTLHNNTWVKNWLWWRVVWAFTWQYIRKELTLMKGGVRLYTT